MHPTDQRNDRIFFAFLAIVMLVLVIMGVASAI